MESVENIIFNQPRPFWPSADTNCAIRYTLKLLESFYGRRRPRRHLWLWLCFESIQPEEFRYRGTRDIRRANCDWQSRGILNPELQKLGVITHASWHTLPCETHYAKKIGFPYRPWKYDRKGLLLCPLQVSRFPPRITGCGQSVPFWAAHVISGL